MLFSLLQSRHNGRLADNICAAVCRLIVAHKDSVPLEQVRAEPDIVLSAILVTLCFR